MNQSHPFSSPSKRARPQTNGEAKDNIWSALLDSVASAKRLPEKNLLVLGGTPETQREFLDTLSSDGSRRLHNRHRKKPPVANEFALGYTYQDVLDADHEDILARLSIYTLPDPSPSFAPLLKPLLKPHTIPDTLLLILLDWVEPWNWARQLRDWIRLVRDVLVSLDDDAKDVMDETMQDWQQRRRGGGAYDNSGSSGRETSITIPLGSGEWDEALGVPLCVVCHNSDKIDLLEKDQSWREEEFDYVLQFLRTILLKHGASLIYTSNSMPNFLPTLVQSTLGIHSTLKRQSLRHNVIDRDKVLIPPNWDSWGKIRILREGFDVEGVSRGWSTDIESSNSNRPDGNNINGTSFTTDEEVDPDMSSTKSSDGGVLLAYEDAIQDPKKNSALAGPDLSIRRLDIEIPSTQVFLASQLEMMDHLKLEEERNQTDRDKGRAGGPSSLKQDQGGSTVDERGRVTDHIGPVQFNMGGIQVDAEDMLNRLKDREREKTPEREGPALPASDDKSQNEALANFFSSLIKRGGGSNSPRSNLSHSD